MAKSLPSLAQLRDIHTDLLRKKAALESLRKQVQREEAMRAAKVAYVGQRTKKFPRIQRHARRSFYLSQSTLFGVDQTLFSGSEKRAGAEGEVK
jgi:hypothetical protein